MLFRSSGSGRDSYEETVRASRGPLTAKSLPDHLPLHLLYFAFGPGRDLEVRAMGTDDRVRAGVAWFPCVQVLVGSLAAGLRAS